MHLTPAFQSLSPAARRGLWLASVAAAVAYSVFLRDQGAPLLEWMTRGIVTLELPGDPETAQRLIDALGERGRAVATVQVQLDLCSCCCIRSPSAPVPHCWPLRCVAWFPAPVM